MQWTDMEWSVLMGGWISLLLLVIAYFLRQLLGNFARVQRELEETKTMVAVLAARLGFIERYFSSKWRKE